VRTLAPHTEAQPTLFSCYGSPPFLPGGNLVRIVRTFKPFREPIFLPPDTVLRADAAMRGMQKVSWTELILSAASQPRVATVARTQVPQCQAEPCASWLRIPEAQPEPILLPWLATFPPERKLSAHSAHI
jgi:hypothetical protein